MLAAQTDAAEEAFWGPHQVEVLRCMDRMRRMSMVRRLWMKDASLWTRRAEHRQDIAARLGWLDVADRMSNEVSSLEAFADQVRREDCRQAVLFGMGGSSLAAEVFFKVFGKRPGYPALAVLDSTDPGNVRALARQADIRRTLFIVSSKSGGTIEPVSLFKFFFHKAQTLLGAQAGGRFVAITDPGTPLAVLAGRHRFRQIFLAPPDIGGRFSALSVFGLVPASLVGVDVGHVLQSARDMMRRCSPDTAPADHPAIALAAGLAALSRQGRDKLTLVTSRGLESFADWAEQLVAESTGKDRRGVVPVVHEPLGGPGAYGADRFFVGLIQGSRADRSVLVKLEALKKAGAPVLVLRVPKPAGLGGEFFRWEMATALACADLGVNAFDQPDVQAAKDRTRRYLRAGGVSKHRRDTQASAGLLAARFKAVHRGDYIALLEFVPEHGGLRKYLSNLRVKLRRLTRLAVTGGIGPRYLHSTGQLHKGGPNKGIFILVTAAPRQDLPIPGESYTFGELQWAQAMGDLAALRQKNRRVLHVRLDRFSPNTMQALSKKILRAFRPAGRGAAA